MGHFSIRVGLQRVLGVQSCQSNWSIEVILDSIPTKSNMLITNMEEILLYLIRKKVILIICIFLLIFYIFYLDNFLT